jgi:hypothetical protein
MTSRTVDRNRKLWLAKLRAGEPEALETLRDMIQLKGSIAAACVALGERPTNLYRLSPEVRDLLLDLTKDRKGAAR